MKRMIEKMAIAIMNTVSVIVSLGVGFGSLVLLNVVAQKLDLSWNLPWQLSLVLCSLLITITGGATAYLLCIVRDYVYEAVFE